jgi:hypothetical protein
MLKRLHYRTPVSLIRSVTGLPLHANLRACEGVFFLLSNAFKPSADVEKGPTRKGSQAS